LLLPSRTPDLRLLAHLDALLETRSVSEAAERMGISQPAMSRILARLRDQLADPLLVRSGSRMLLTPRAEALAEPLRGWLGKGESLLHPEAFDPVDLNRAFRIGSTDFGILSVIRPALAPMAAAAPQATYEIQALSSDSFKRLADGRLDAVVIGYQPDHPGVRWSRLFSEHRLGLCRQGHPVLAEPMTVDRLFDWPHVAPLIGDGLPEPLVMEGIDLSRRHTLLSAPSFASIPYLVAETDALAVLPSRAARYFAPLHGLAIFEPPMALPTFDYFVAWHERSDNDPATRWLVGELEQATMDHDRRKTGEIGAAPRDPSPLVSVDVSPPQRMMPG